ncbi:putative ubiquitin [Conidiobolus coronatus NRRL 28638]|jgi:small ubiquitin-related modifier|uniref:Putative ubiquitin n=1 Tax=Conidiobolus coronatus (strain ATCC 28846 / CBS 209.66 / NRRL 28638) TaxID=796925 RepID=A0A137NXX8_CONC2|nr:putative ubiquitin [Conidiobolus coronatus NRRL 28638]|eukprot:KXN67562.1 putative ubiquitin [Conidiobolus coronatus NRRL 28638]
MSDQPNNNENLNQKMDQQETKPAVNPEHINIKVVDSESTEVAFKIKRSTPLKKLMDAYCDKQGKSPSSVRFLYDGDRVQPADTPASLGMEDQDTIDVMVEQVGGACY